MDVPKYPSGTTAFIECLKLDIRNQAAWEEFVRRFQANIYALVFARLRNRADAEDATQNTLLRLLAVISRFDRSRGKFRPWMSTIAWRIAQNIAKTLKNGGDPVAGNDELLDETPDPQETGQLDRHIEWWSVQEMLQRLHQDDSKRVEAFRRLLGGETVADVSAALGMTPAAVYQAKYWVTRRLGELRQQFDEEGPGRRDGPG